MADKNLRKAEAPHDASPIPQFESTYKPSANDVFELSTQLGGATVAEARALTEGSSDADLVRVGNDFATPRVKGDALRILGVAAEFFRHAPKAERDALDMTVDVVRIGAWTAAENVRAYEAHRSAIASAKARSSGALAEAEAVVERARNEKKRFSDTLRAVGQRSATETAIAHALAPGAHGEANTGPDVSLSLLAKEGRALLASTDENVTRRAATYRLTRERVAQVEALAKEAKEADKVINAPKVVITQTQVDWWDGLTYAILQTVVRAFQGAHAFNPKVPALDFVSLRKRGAAGTEEGDPPKDGEGNKGGGGE